MVSEKLTSVNHDPAIKVHISRDTAVILFLSLASLAIYWQVTDYAFVSFDDMEYIVENSGIQEGLGFSSIYWAFTNFYSANWHPLTWISHALDISIYGFNSGSHHFVNIIFHIGNASVLYVFLKKISGSKWRSVVIAVCFAVHPINVETVAWISQRKTLLCTFFGLLVGLSYDEYVKGRMMGYWLALLCYMLSLLAKPMLVTMPFVLMLLDYWPYGRYSHKGVIKLFAEKLSFFLLAGASSIVTFMAQNASDAVAPLHVFPISIRLSNVAISYVRYAEKLIFPTKLAAFYPYSLIGFSEWETWVAILIIMLTLMLAFHLRATVPALTIGVLWYFGTMIPVIGLVQVGSQSMADRYAYFPSIGLFLSLMDLKLKVSPRHRAMISLFLFIIITCLICISWHQAGYWKDSVTLFKRVVSVSPKSQMGHFNLAVAFEKNGRRDLAEIHYKKAVKINPKHVSALNNLGLIMMENGNFRQAIYYYVKGLRIEPENHKILNNLGTALMKQGKNDFALQYFVKALKVKPIDAKIHNNLGVTLFRLKKFKASLKHFERAVELSPQFFEARKNLKKAKKALGI